MFPLFSLLLNYGTRIFIERSAPSLWTLPILIVAIILLIPLLPIFILAAGKLFYFIFWWTFTCFDFYEKIFAKVKLMINKYGH